MEAAGNVSPSGTVPYLSVSLGDLQVNFVESFSNKRSFVDSHSHYHAFFEVHFVWEGVLKISSDGETVTLYPGEACLIPPHLQHFACREEPQGDAGGKPDGELGWTSLFFDLRRGASHPKDGGGEYSNYHSLYQKIVKLHWLTLGEDALYRAALERIPGIFSRPGVGGVHQIRALLSLIFLELSQQVADSLPNRGREETDAPAKGQGSVSSSPFETENIRKWRIESYISQNYHRDASLQELAQQLYLSVKQTERILRQQMGYGFREALLRQRMAMAWELILSGGQPLEEVGRQVGYESYSGFGRIFRRYFGITPSQLREHPEIQSSGADRSLMGSAEKTPE